MSQDTIPACLRAQLAGWAALPDAAAVNVGLGDLRFVCGELERLTPKPSPFEHLASAVYRSGPPTEVDYDEAIDALYCAKRALTEGDSMGCQVCEDSGHSAHDCHHNPLLLARKWAAATGLWQCWHCGFIATTDEEGREHFGAHDGEPAACLQAASLTRAIGDIAAERRRQVEAEGWTTEHDDGHPHGQLSKAGALYAAHAVRPDNDWRYRGVGHPPPGWPWAATWWKPKGPRADLVRAAALIAAEIERLDRATAVRS